MLLYPPIKDLLGRVPSRYMLEEKAVSLAIQEVADGTLTLEEAEAELEGAGEAEEEPAGEDGNEEI